MERAEELIKKYDQLVSQENDEKTEQWLLETCSAYDAEYPDDISGRCALYNEAGSFYRHRDRAKESISWFLKAKSLMETPVQQAQSGCKSCYYTAEFPDEIYGFKETSFERTVNYANTINNLAGAYRLTGQFEEAKELFQKAIEIYEPNENIPEPFLCSAFNNLALVFLDLGEEEAALVRFRKALAILEKTDDNYFEKATTCANMAVAYYRLKQARETEGCMRSAEQYYLAGGLENSPAFQAFLNLKKMIGIDGN